jgi:hypothetical protein
MSELMSGPVRLAAALDGPRDAPVLVLGGSSHHRDLWEPSRAGSTSRLLRYGHPGTAARPPRQARTPSPTCADVLRLLDEFEWERVVLWRVARWDGRDVAL